MAIKEYLRRVFPGTAEEFCQKAGDAMVSGKRLFVVTANPEILMHAGEDPAIRQLLLAEETAVVPDGISVVKAMNLLGLPAKERITGVDLADKLLRRAGEQGKSVYLLGAKEEVVSALAQKLKAQYPQMEVRYKNGYSKDKDADFREIEAFQPDLVLVDPNSSGAQSALEEAGVTVLSVEPATDRSDFERLGRFYRNNIKFLGEVRKEAKG